MEDIIQKKYPPGLTDYDLRILSFCSEWLNDKKEFELQTSGSTGVPKTIMATSDKMKFSAGMTAKAIGLQPGDRSLICINTDYIGGRMMLVRGLFLHLEMVVIPPSSNPLEDFPDDIHFDFTAMVPLQLETVLNKTSGKKIILDGMKGILLGGAAIHPSLEEKVQLLKAPVFHTFGMTETLSHIALRRVNGTGRQDYFELLEGIQIETDHRNCLIIHSPFSSSPIVTNDVIEKISERKFRWLGRADFIINSGGIKVHPEKVERELEKYFSSSGMQQRFFITSIKDRLLGEAVTLFLEDKTWDRIEKEKLKKKIKEVVGPYQAPKAIYIVPKFEETPTGKIDRKKTVEKAGF